MGADPTEKANEVSLWMREAGFSRDGPWRALLLCLTSAVLKEEELVGLHVANRRDWQGPDLGTFDSPPRVDGTGPRGGPVTRDASASRSEVYGCDGWTRVKPRDPEEASRLDDMLGEKAGLRRDTLLFLPPSAPAALSALPLQRAVTAVRESLPGAGGSMMVHVPPFWTRLRAAIPTGQTSE